MAHIDDLHAHPHADDESTSNLKVAFLLNASFAIIELVGGLWTGSVAILSDALHDLGDSTSLGLAWYLQRLSVRRGDRRYSYGYRRFSLLGAMANTAILLVGSAIVLSETIPRLFDPVLPDAQGMLLLSFLGIGVNALAAARLSRDQSLSARAVTLHLMQDILGWLGVLVVSVVLLFRDMPILDPLLSIVISAWVIYNALRGLKHAASLFLQAVPAGVNLAEMEARLEAVDGVLSVHHTHVWSLDGVHHVFTTHLVVPEETTPEGLVDIKCAARDALDNPAIQHTTLELEFLGESCAMREWA